MHLQRSIALYQRHNEVKTIGSDISKRSHFKVHFGLKIHIQLLRVFTTTVFKDQVILFPNLTFKSVYEILWCYHSNETSLAVQSYTVLLFISYVVLTFESLDENLLCYHSTETSFVDLFHSTICFLGFYKIKTYFFFFESFYFGQFYQTERVLKVSEMKSKYLEN